MKYLYTHLGLGDQIICNGMARHFVDVYGELAVFCKTKYESNLRHMYLDDNRIKIIALPEPDYWVEKYIRDNNIEKDVIKAGFELGKSFNIAFDESFYKCVNLPFEYRFTKFRTYRDLYMELKVCKILNPNNEKYIFTHNIDRTKVRSDLKIIENPTEYSIFDLLTLIDNAEEVHIMESSIKCLIGSIKMDNPKFFFHRYVRGGPHDSKSINQFTIID